MKILLEPGFRWSWHSIDKGAMKNPRKICLINFPYRDCLLGKDCSPNVILIGVCWNQCFLVWRDMACHGKRQTNWPIWIVTWRASVCWAAFISIKSMKHMGKTKHFRSLYVSHFPMLGPCPPVRRLADLCSCKVKCAGVNGDNLCEEEQLTSGPGKLKF